MNEVIAFALKVITYANQGLKFNRKKCFATL